MPFYNSIAVKAKDLAERYNREVVMFDDERYVVPARSRNTYPIITNDNKVQLYQWGLIPNKKIDIENTSREDIETAVQKAFTIQKKTFNTKTEDIFNVPFYKNLILRQRCIIPSTGYIQSHYFTTRIKQPYLISIKNEKVFSTAGVYDYWTHPVTGIVHQTFSMLTVSAEDNKLISWIDNGGRSTRRMPVIIERENEEKWLDKDLTEKDIKVFFKAYPSEGMDAFAITNDFNLTENSHNPLILEPVEQEIC